MKTNIRNINLDLIRTIAVLTVLSVHSFSYCGYYESPLTSPLMHIATIIRSVFIICVPLFLLLTGYLMHKKTISKKYFVNLARVLIIYIASTFVILIYRIFVLKEQLNWLDIIHNLTSFQQYSWYIEMYIGLYLFIPFLNIIYNNINKREKKLLIGILIFMTSVAPIANSFGYLWVPDYWTDMYPITYYFIGAYLSEYSYDIKVNSLRLFLLFILLVVGVGTYIYYAANGTVYKWPAYGAYECVFNIFTSTVLFLCILKLNLDNIPDLIKKIIMVFSTISLPLYLMSWMSDSIVYSNVNLYLFDFSEKLRYMPFMVLSTLLICFPFAYLVTKVGEIIMKNFKGR